MGLLKVFFIVLTITISLVVILSKDLKTVLLYLFFFGVFYLIGTLMNRIVIGENKDRMPILTDFNDYLDFKKKGYDKDRYSIHYKKENIKYWWLSDYLKIQTKGWTNYWSWGDFVILLSPIIGLWVALYVI